MTERQGNVALDLSAGLWALAWPLLAGLLVGFLVLRTLQRRGLRWSWTFVGVPLAYLLWFADWRLGLFLTVATLTALWHGARAHAEAIQHGGEEAAEKRDARGPLRLAASLRRRSRAKRDRLDRGGLAIGIARHGGLCRVPFGHAHGVHALISGATGAGKTVTQAAIAQAHVLAGQPVIVIDPKGDQFLRATLADAAEQAGVRFRAWSPGGEAIYNPLARGNPTEIADKALAGHQWSEPHYELATQRLLLHSLAAMREAGRWPPTLGALSLYMEPERLGALADEVGGETKARVGAYVGGLSERAKADLGGGRDRLAVLSDSELGPLLGPEIGAGAIDLAEVIERREVVYFHLDADRYPAAAKLLGAALLVDLISLTADLQGSGSGGLLVIDEFAALAAEQVSRLFARARSAGLSLLLGTQSLADLRGARLGDGTDTLTEQVLSNIEFALVHRVGDPDSAERFARLAGTAPSWSTTERVAGNGTMLGRGEGTRTREREFLLGPDQFKRLRTGEAILINAKAKRPAQIVKVWPPRSGLTEVPQ
jgi:hypothetical protein